MHGQKLIKTFYNFISVKINLADVVSYLKLFQIGISLLSKQYYKSVMPVDPIIFLNMIDAGMSLLSISTASSRGSLDAKWFQDTNFT